MGSSDIKDSKVPEKLVKSEKLEYPDYVGWSKRDWAFVDKLKFIFYYEVRVNPENKIMAPIVIACWLICLFLFLRIKHDRKIVAFTLFLVTPLVLLIARSTYWAAAVPVGVSFAGLLSREDYEYKLATMADTALGLGLILTLLGLGQIIGPAIVEHDVSKIGYGVSVKIEATVTGIFLSLILNTLIARRKR